MQIVIITVLGGILNAGPLLYRGETWWGFWVGGQEGHLKIQPLEMLAAKKRCSIMYIKLNIL